MISKLLGIGFSVLILHAEVFGGPTPPQLPVNNLNQGADNWNQRAEDRLDEISPLIDDITFKTSPTTLEVFIHGTAMTDCYDKIENRVEIKKTHTNIITRMIRSTPEEACKEKLKSFTTKVAELDIHDPQSREIRVLGFRGWHIRHLESQDIPHTDAKK